MDETGFFCIADRLKRMINAAGFKVWPTEIEATLYKHPAIKDVAIVSAPDERRGETVKAYVVLNDAAQLSEADLIAGPDGWGISRNASGSEPNASRGQ